MTVTLTLTSFPSVRDLCPATLSTLPLDAAQLRRLSAIGAGSREFELSLLIYAHLYDETCRTRLVARLTTQADLALQAHWQAHRASFIARALVDYDRAMLIERAHRCAAGFDEIGHEFSADITRSYAEALKNGMPPALYSYQISTQEQRLIDKRGEAIYKNALASDLIIVTIPQFARVS